METYGENNAGYAVFGANMTVDISQDNTSKTVVACRKCQCNCRLCRGGRVPDESENLSGLEIEEALEVLLAA